MKIGAVAARSGLPPKTIRYYESIGLIRSADRAANGYRAYDEADLRTLRFIQRARSLGLTIEDVTALLGLWRDRRPSAEVKELVLERIAQIERKLLELASLRWALLDLAEHCQGNERPECPIIDELAGPVTNGGRPSPAKRPTSGALTVLPVGTRHHA
jgi:MerR family transcriptional regulator, copper efflux regulator